MRDDPLRRPCRLRATLAAAVLAALLMAGSATAASSRGTPRPVREHAARGTLPDTADWQKIQAAARLRGMALAPHRTAHFRAVAAQLGLRELVSIQPLAPGRCAIAVRYLYNNLLDLENAYSGEDWRPLRRLVAKEPSIQACSPAKGRRARAPRPRG